LRSVGHLIINIQAVRRSNVTSCKGLKTAELAQ
jgi:hypothetical protein